MHEGVIRRSRALLAVFVAIAVMGAATGVGAQTADSASARHGDSTSTGVAGDGRIVYAVSRTRLAIEVDGRLDEEGWATAVRIPLPYEVDPGQNTPAPVTTECRIAFDDEYLFLGCMAHDPDPTGIRAFITDRDDIDGHDRIVLTLDPFNDQRRAFQFGISALGVQSDAVLAQQGSRDLAQVSEAMVVDPSWDAIWISAGRRVPDGYVVEAAVPFQSLRFPTGDAPHGWGAFLARWWPRSTNVEIRSAPWNRNNGCLLCQANILSGIEGGSSGLNVQLTPTLTTARSDTRSDFPGGPLEAGEADPQLGIDGQWGITSDMTLNLTANPDFSQVEADVAQLDVNNRFALFFPETRPFFLEGADFFATPVQAVFTRSISDPILGGKVTGKLGANALGLLLARDRVNNLLLPGSQISSTARLETRVSTAVARVRRDMGTTSTLGGLFTAREGEGYHNRVGGIDAFYRPVDPLSVEMQFLRSETAYPAEIVAAHDQPAGAFDGSSVRARAEWSSRDWQSFATAERTTPGFRADAGFVTQTGITFADGMVMRRWWGAPDAWYRQLGFQAGAWRIHDLEGNPLTHGMWLRLDYVGPAQSVVSVGRNSFITEYFAGVTYPGMAHQYFTASAHPTGSVSLTLSGGLGDAVDIANERLGTSASLSPGLSVRAGRNLDLTLSHTFERLQYRGQNVFTAHLAELRTVYNFSARSFVRAIVQFRQVDRDPDLYDAQVDARSRNVFTQLLYSYKVNPQTVLFAGYTDEHDGLTEVNGRHIDLTQRGRTFFLKLGYAWRP